MDGVPSTSRACAYQKQHDRKAHLIDRTDKSPPRSGRGAVVPNTRDVTFHSHSCCVPAHFPALSARVSTNHSHSRAERPLESCLPTLRGEQAACGRQVECKLSRTHPLSGMRRRVSSPEIGLMRADIKVEVEAQGDYVRTRLDALEPSQRSARGQASIRRRFA